MHSSAEEHGSGDGGEGELLGSAGKGRSKPDVPSLSLLAKFQI